MKEGESTTLIKEAESLSKKNPLLEENREENRVLSSSFPDIYYLGDWE